MATKNLCGLSPKAISLLRKVQRYILEEPKRLGMYVWGERYDKNYHGRLGKKAFPACGTTACIAGTVHLLSAKKSDLPGEAADYFEWDDFFSGSRVTATNKLGLTREQEERLFYVNETDTYDSTFGYDGIRVLNDDGEAVNYRGELTGWPKKFSLAYNNAKTAKKRAQVAVDRIEHFIKTGV